MRHRVIDRPRYVNDNIDSLSSVLEERGMTQRSLESKSGLTRGRITKWICEGIYPTRENYNKLAEYLGWRLWE